MTSRGSSRFRFAILASLSTLAVIGAAGSVDTSSAASQPDDHHDARFEFQSAEEAEAHDLALVAEAKVWSLAEAEADRRAADVVGDIAERVAAKHPDVFVGSVLSEDPRGAPALYVKGPTGCGEVAQIRRPDRTGNKPNPMINGPQRVEPRGLGYSHHPFSCSEWRLGADADAKFHDGEARRRE